MCHPSGGWDRHDPNTLVHSSSSQAYANSILKHFFTPFLQGKKIVLDCANGATHEVAPVIFQACGAQVTAINASPNGININDRDKRHFHLIREILHHANYRHHDHHQQATRTYGPRFQTPSSRISNRIQKRSHDHTIHVPHWHSSWHSSDPYYSPRSMPCWH